MTRLIGEPSQRRLFPAPADKGIVDHERANAETRSRWRGRQRSARSPRGSRREDPSQRSCALFATPVDKGIVDHERANTETKGRPS
jgi:hypothetical protein